MHEELFRKLHYPPFEAAPVGLWPGLQRSSVDRYTGSADAISRLSTGRAFAVLASCVLSVDEQDAVSAIIIVMDIHNLNLCVIGVLVIGPFPSEFASLLLIARIAFP